MNKLKAIIDKDKAKTIIIYTLIFMILAHGFCYTNTLFSHDSMRTFFWNSYDTIKIGRYLIPLFVLIRGKYYPPLLIGTFTYIYIIIIIYLIVELFSIKKKKNIIITSGILSTASTLTLLNATYILDSDLYMFAFLLATIGAYIWRKYKYGYIIAIIPVLLLLPIYQAYICCFTGLVSLLVLKDLLENKKIKDICKNTGYAIITTISSMILYAISLKLVNHILNIELRNSYNSVSAVGKFSGIQEIFDLLIGTYRQFFYYITHPSTYYSLLVCIFNISLIIITLYVCIKKLLKNKNKDKMKRVLLFVIIILLIPFIFNFIYFLGKGVEHQLMIYPFFLLYIFVIMSTEDTFIKKKIYPVIVTIISSIIILSNIIYANQCYLIKYLNTNTTLTTVNRIIDRIEQTNGYEIGKTKVTIIGNLNYGPLKTNRKEINVNDPGMADNFGLTYYETNKQYFENYLAYPINIISKEDMEKISKKQKVKDMPCFPDKDSIQFIGDTLVIKVSN